MTEPTYTDRRQEILTVEKRLHSGDSYAITGSTGWTSGCSKEVYDLLPEGKEYLFETKNFSMIAGWCIDGVWYDRKSDQDFDREHQEFIEKYNREKQTLLAKNREKWRAEEDALPDWLRDRLQTFHERGGEKFRLDGWGYELMVCRIAAAYYNMGGAILGKSMSEIEDSAEVTKLSEENGTSGNQHGVALALAQAHLREPETSLAGTISALSPLTGDAFYEGD